MTILSEFAILERICEGEAGLYGDGTVPPELQSCLTLIDSKKTKPESQDLLQLRGLFEKYSQSSAYENDKANRIEKIRAAVAAGPCTGLLFDDLALDSLKGMVYDLRVGNEAYISSGKNTIRLGPERGRKDTVTIRPGDFAIIMTHEYMALPPDVMGFISVRMRYKRKGLVNISGFHVDPGFHGRIMFAVYNAGPRDIVLRHKDSVFMILFANVEHGLQLGDGAFAGQTNIPSDVISDLSGPSVSLRSLDSRLSRLETVFYFVIVPSVVAAVAAVITYLLK